MKPEELASAELSIETTDGWILKVNEFLPSSNTAKAVLIVLPAMGAHAKPYRYMASDLSKSGHIVLTVDPRGHGKSLPHPRRGVDYGFDDILQQDIPAVIEYATNAHSNLPIFLIGHSLGGHLSAAYIAENPDKVAGLITLTSSHLYFKTLGFPSIFFFTAFVLMAKILGYVPGQHVGWGTPIARQQVLDWAKFGFSGKFHGTDGRLIEPDIKKITTPSLCVGFTDDKTLAPAKSVRRFAEMLPADKTTIWLLSPDDLDTHTLGHFDHLRNGAKLWTKLDQWITERA